MKNGQLRFGTELALECSIGQAAKLRTSKNQILINIDMSNSVLSALQNLILTSFLKILTFSLFFSSTLARSQTTLTADTNRPTVSTYATGEKVEILFSIENIRVNESVGLEIELLDEYGKALAKPELIRLRGDSNNKAVFVFTAPSSKLGYYEVRAKLSDGTALSRLGTRDAGFITYAVVPNPRERIDYGDALSRFGLQGGFNKNVVVLPYLGARYVIAGNDWSKMEPGGAGQFLRDVFKAASSNKRHPPKSEESENPTFQNQQWATYPLSILTSASIPSWAMREGTSGSICKKFGALNDEGKRSLESFALAQAKVFSLAYKTQRSRHYQVTWEPANGWCYQGTASELVDFYSSSFNSIHQSDPSAVVSGPTLFIDSESTKQLEKLFSAGLGAHIDALSFHPYVKKFPPERNGLPSILREQLDIAKKAVGRELPFIGTEHGFKSVTDGNLNKALGDIRTTIIMLGEGAIFDIAFYVADFWDGDDTRKSDGYGFFWNLNPRIRYGTDKLGPKVVVPAYAAMTYFLDGSTTEGRLAGLTDTQLGYRFIKGGVTIDVAWDYSAKSKFKVTPGFKSCDWMGNCLQENETFATLDGAPRYFISKEVK
ncbi:MAG: hypothetical protein H7240_05625 [Glaciimonas sp.]|nr:hypothetical protein [Glaciimonas sp.]